jgi:hypothetical protein
MARRESFDAGNQRKDSHGSCTHCGEGLGSAGTMRRGGDMFDAHGESVYTKRREAVHEHDASDNSYTKYSPGKYCNNCNSAAERAEYYS